MEIYFSRHARRQMRWRRISDIEVEAVLAEPDREEPTRKGRKNAWRAVNQRLLKVTYRGEAGRLVVVTVVDKRE
jgi:hypothetical protein